MRTFIIVLVAGVLTFAAPASAEENPLKWRYTKPADVISTGLVFGQIGLEAWSNFRAPDRRHALGCMALRNGLAIGATELTKALVHRTRPDASDRKSFFSEHTALASLNSGWRFQVSVPIAISTGYLRSAANKHFASDVIVGAGVGALVRFACNDGRPATAADALSARARGGSSK